MRRATGTSRIRVGDPVLGEPVETLTLTHDPADVARAEVASGRAGVDRLDDPGPGFTAAAAHRLP